MPALEDITITHYRLYHRLAQGGMSEIYLAEDLYTRQTVAIKLVNIEQREYQERFQREVEAIAALRHDHILPAFDYGAYGPWYYMVMPYIANGTLRDRLAHGPLSLKEAGMILEQLADALEFAHKRKLLHRDIKPSNILLRDGEHVYLADFGLVKHIDGHSHITQTGCLIGTPEYMAPELAEGEATTRSDIYAAGVVLYQMLTGRVPFKSHSPLGIYWKHQREQPMPPSLLNATITRQVELVILRALEKDPQRRFSSAREFANAYRQAIEPITRPYTRPATSSTRKQLESFFTSRVTMPRLAYLPSVKTVATAITALLLLCVLPTILGFSLYHNQSQSSTQFSNLGANVLYKNGVPPYTPTSPPPTTTPTTTATSHPSTNTKSAPSVTTSIYYALPNQNNNYQDPDPTHGPRNNSGHKDKDHNGHGHDKDHHK